MKMAFRTIIIIIMQFILQIPKMANLLKESKVQIRIRVAFVCSYIQCRKYICIIYFIWKLNEYLALSIQHPLHICVLFIVVIIVILKCTTQCQRHRERFVNINGFTHFRLMKERSQKGAKRKMHVLWESGIVVEKSELSAAYALLGEYAFWCELRKLQK